MAMGITPTISKHSLCLRLSQFHYSAARHPRPLGPPLFCVIVLREAPPFSFNPFFFFVISSPPLSRVVALTTALLLAHQNDQSVCRSREVLHHFFGVKLILNVCQQIIWHTKGAVMHQKLNILCVDTKKKIQEQHGAGLLAPNRNKNLAWHRILIHLFQFAN